MRKIFSSEDIKGRSLEFLRYSRSLNQRYKSLAICLQITLIVCAGPVTSKPLVATDAEQQVQSKETESSELDKSIKEIVSEFEVIEGFFRMYRDPNNGSLYMLVRTDQLHEEFIYFSYAENGVVAARAFRGAYRDQSILKFRKYFDRLELIEENTNFYFDPDSTMARASDANISPAVKASLSIEAVSEDGDAYLVKMDSIFLTEALQSIAPNANPKKKPYEQFSLGKLSEDKSSYRSVRGYPENVNILVDYVYNNKKPYVRGGAEVTDPRYVTLTFQHSFIQNARQQLSTPDRRREGGLLL